MVKTGWHNLVFDTYGKNWLKLKWSMGFCHLPRRLDDVVSHPTLRRLTQCPTMTSAGGTSSIRDVMACVRHQLAGSLESKGGGGGGRHWRGQGMDRVVANGGKHSK